MRLNDPATTRCLTMEVTWAITLEATEFFDQMTTTEQLERDRPKFPNSRFEVSRPFRTSREESHVNWEACQWSRKQTATNSTSHPP